MDSREKIVIQLGKKKKNDSLKKNAVEHDRHTMRTMSAPSFTNKRNNNRSSLHRS